MKRCISGTWSCLVLAGLAVPPGGAQAAVVASWDFEEAGGITVFDGVGSNHATIGAGTGSRVTTGELSGALGQSWSGGTANILTSIYANQYDSLTSASTEAWVKWDGSGLYNAWLSLPGTFEQFNHTGVPGVRFLMGGVDSLYLPVGIATPGQWQQWVMTYDAPTTTMKVYANAVEVFSSNAGTGLNWGAAVLDRFGLNSGGTYNNGMVAGGVFSGMVDHLSIHNVALSPAEVLARYEELVTGTPPPGLVSVAVTRFRTWQAFRPFTQTAWGTHQNTSAPNEVDVPYFLGSGLNTVSDEVRSGSSSLQHPNSHGLPTLLHAQQAYQPDLNAFLADFNLAKTFHSNLIGVNLGDEVREVFGQGGLQHGRVIRDWIVQNSNPEISSLITLSSNPAGDQIADHAYAQELWNNTREVSRPDIWIAQIYPFTGAGLSPSYYRSLQYYRDWSQANVAMWVAPQAYGSSESAVPSESELRLQRFTSLAYGVQGFSDFLWNSGDPDGPTIQGAGYSDGQGAPTNPTPMYQQLAPINREITNVAQSLIRLNHTRAYHSDSEPGVFHFSDSDADLPPDHRRSGALTSVTSSNGNRVLTGFFRDPAGEEYFLVVNKRSAENMTSAQLSSFVTLSFDPSVTAIRRLRRSDGMVEAVPIGPGHTYTYSLTGGTGDLFKIDNGAPFMGIERLHYEHFEGPYHRSTPDSLSVLDPTWTTGGLTGLFGATGSLLVKDAVGVDGSRGAREGASGLAGNQRRIPDGPLFNEWSLVILEGQLSFNTPLESLGSGQLANLLLASDAAGGHLPLINFEAGDGDVGIEAGSLGGLPAQVSLSNGAGVSGDGFHLFLQVDLEEKRLRASVSGDARLTTGWLSYTSDFVPSQIGIVAGRVGDLSGTTWDNVSVTTLATMVGDLNGDGFIGQDDLNLILGAWGQTVTAGNWKLGDSNGDSFVGQDDLNDILSAWGQGTPPATATSQPVPEPAAFWFASLAGTTCTVYALFMHGWSAPAIA